MKGHTDSPQFSSGKLSADPAVGANLSQYSAGKLYCLAFRFVGSTKVNYHVTSFNCFRAP